jgi:hypothetical protein
VIPKDVTAVSDTPLPVCWWSEKML